MSPIRKIDAAELSMRSGPACDLPLGFLRRNNRPSVTIDWVSHHMQAKFPVLDWERIGPSVLQVHATCVF
jgi:hypothetical protein